MSARILDIGSTRSPAHGSGIGNRCPPGGPKRGPDGAAVAGPPDSMKPSMSRLVTRPATPDPCKAAMFTPCSAAIFLTSGEDFVRTRSSNEFPLPEWDAAMAGADGCWRAAVGARLTSRWGPDGGDGAFVALLASAGCCVEGLALGVDSFSTAAPFSVSSLATTV